MILATLLLIILSYLLYQFGLRRTEVKPDVRLYIPGFIVFGALLLLTSIFALNDVLTAIAPQNLDPIRTVADLQDTIETAEITSEQVLLVGTVGELPDGTLVTTATEMIFPMQLEDDTVDISTADDTLAIQWPQGDDPDGPRVLEPGQAIVVLATPQQQDLISAEAIYPGTVEDYWAFLPRFVVLPGLTSILSLVAGLMVMAVPFVRYQRLPAA